MPQRELGNLLAVNRYLTFNINKEKELQQVAVNAAEICGVPTAVITLLDNENQYVRFYAGVPVVPLEEERFFYQLTIRQEEVLVIKDAHPDARFYAGIPITTIDELIVGTVGVFGSVAKDLTNIQLKMLQSLPDQILNLLEFDTSLQLLKEQFDESKVAENKLRAFFDSSSSCHLLLDNQLQIVSFNKCLSDVIFSIYKTKLTVEMEITDYIYPEFVETFKKRCYAALGGESSVAEQYVKSELGQFSWHITFDPARNPNGEIIGVSYNATDINKKIEHEELLRMQNESFEKIDYIQNNDLMESIHHVNVLMKTMIENNSTKNIQEIRLMESSVKELNDIIKTI